jgi:hypothetical protein
LFTVPSDMVVSQNWAPSSLASLVSALRRSALANLAFGSYRVAG